MAFGVCAVAMPVPSVAGYVGFQQEVLTTECRI
jgi:hypothetical protein